MKKTIILLAMVTLGISQVAMGQNDKEKMADGYVDHQRAYHADDTSVVNGHGGVGWVRSHFFDSWFFELQGGGQLYYATDDRLGEFGDRLTGNVEFYLGRRIFPMFGFRAGLGLGYAHGFITREHYSMLAGHGHSGQCGNDENGNPLGGYFYLYDKDNNLLIQKWNYFSLGADLFLDLAIFKGAKRYNPYKPFNNYIYGGVHTKWGLSETDTTNHRSEAHLGFICKYNVTPNLGIFLDVRGSLMERTFDREYVPVVETPRSSLDPIFNAQLGVIYKFNIRSDDERDYFTYRENVRKTNENTIRRRVFIQTADRYHKDKYEELFIYDTIKVPSPAQIRRKNELQHELDSLLDNGMRTAMGRPLDTILLGNLLPYEMVFFELDKWDILPEEEMKIERMAMVMRAHPKEIFILTGSADSKTGTPRRNDFLSHNRADVVYNTLITRYGIPPQQLRREYLGGILDYEPFHLNRCTVIIIDHPDVQKAFNEMKKQGKAGGGSVKVK